MASEVRLLPQPDSPTIASVSPAATEKSTPRTGRVVPPGTGISTLRPRTSRSGGAVTPAPPARSRRARRRQGG